MKPGDDYDAAADFGGSINECYRAIRERIARGGPPWVPPEIPQIPQIPGRPERDRAERTEVP